MSRFSLRRRALKYLLRARRQLSCISAISGVHQYTCWRSRLPPGTERAIEASRAALMYLRRSSASSTTLLSLVVPQASQLQAETMAVARSISLSISLRRHLGGERNDICTNYENSNLNINLLLLKIIRFDKLK